MNRLELKTKAKELIKDNKWYIWKPSIIFALIVGLISGIAYIIDDAMGGITTVSYEFMGEVLTRPSMGTVSTIMRIVTSFAGLIFAVAYAYYILSFIRGQKMEMNGIVNFAKENWVIAVLVSIVYGLIVAGCSVLLVIPGIIASIGLEFYKEVCADNPELGAMDVVKKTWAMTKGHKSEIFVLGLSFIGWAFLSAFTLGILYIWLAPYMTIAFTLFYEQIKN
jgi:uncharacterized membrane protein